MISMNQVWDDSVAFLRREAALLVPLALATVYVADVVASLATVASKPGEANPFATIGILAAAIWSVIGQLSIVSLVLQPGQSVGEALAHGVARLGKVALVALLLGLVISIAVVPVAVAVVASGVDPQDPASLQKLPGWASLIILVGVGVLIWLGVRLALMNAYIVDRNPGVIEALKGGFALTRGIAARLFFVVALYGLILAVLGSAVRFVTGSLFALIGAAIQSPFAGAVMTALVSGIVTTALSLVATVFLATLYRKVTGRDVANIF
jgi:hypothetical protein